MTPSIVRESLAAHLRSYAIRTDGPFLLRSGQITDWYMDARQTTFSGEGGLLVGAAVWEHLDSPDAVGGMTMGADPIAIATALHATGIGSPLRAFSIRKAAKDHGTGGRLVGPVGRGDRVAILEDTTTTGGTIMEAIRVAEEEGLEVVQVVVLVDRSKGAADGLVTERNIRYTAVLRPVDLGIRS